MLVCCMTLDDPLPHTQRIHSGHQIIRKTLYCCDKATSCLGEPSFSGDVQDEGVAGISKNLSTLVSDKFVSINSYL